MANIISYLSDQDPGQADSRVAPNGNLLHLDQFPLARERVYKHIMVPECMAQWQSNSHSQFPNESNHRVFTDHEHYQSIHLFMRKMGEPKILRLEA